ncbi:unnamed protein product [Microthlaspi erraticum]|uniref:Uncharacterized protein n=1 Tax=Microthlaspi erraticum TaxID=1685480 RepID=A0A6D2J3N5_9BRAS|nr:unnamed protein product [Microthlaspi erraticum]
MDPSVDLSAFFEVTAYESQCDDHLPLPIKQSPPICVFIAFVRNLEIATKMSQIASTRRRSPRRFLAQGESLSIQELINTCPRRFLEEDSVFGVYGLARFFLTNGTVKEVHCPLTQIVLPDAGDFTPRVERFKSFVCDVFQLGTAGYRPIKCFFPATEDLCRPHTHHIVDNLVKRHQLEATIAEVAHFKYGISNPMCGMISGYCAHLLPKKKRAAKIMIALLGREGVTYELIHPVYTRLQCGSVILPPWVKKEDLHIPGPGNLVFPKSRDMAY